VRCANNTRVARTPTPRNLEIADKLKNCGQPPARALSGETAVTVARHEELLSAVAHTLADGKHLHRVIYTIKIYFFC
jgi:Ser/Thr protein kinase RdoA (MazF antagonist)